VLPVRFGTVMAAKDAVAGDLLAACQEALAAALTEAEGRAQFVVQGRYVEQAMLAEALAELPEAASLRKQIRGKTPPPPGGRGSGWVRSSATRSRPRGPLTHGPWPRSWPLAVWPAGSGSRPMSWTPFMWRCWSRFPAGTIWHRCCRAWPRTGKDLLRCACSARWPRTTSPQPRWFHRPQPAGSHVRPPGIRRSGSRRIAA
jgi:Gas vesicle synthesis protein GvpL/GvpF